MPDETNEKLLIKNAVANFRETTEREILLYNGELQDNPPHLTGLSRTIACILTQNRMSILDHNSNNPKVYVLGISSKDYSVFDVASAIDRIYLLKTIPFLHPRLFNFMLSLGEKYPSRLELALKPVLEKHGIAPEKLETKFDLDEISEMKDAIKKRKECGEDIKVYEHIHKSQTAHKERIKLMMNRIILEKDPCIALIDTNYICDQRLYDSFENAEIPYLASSWKYQTVQKRKEEESTVYRLDLPTEPAENWIGAKRIFERFESVLGESIEIMDIPLEEITRCGNTTIAIISRKYIIEKNDGYILSTISASLILERDRATGRKTNAFEVTIPLEAGEDNSYVFFQGMQQI